MHDDDVGPEPCLRCTVLRQADYKPGTWLFSDIHSHMGLYYEISDERLRRWQSSPGVEFHDRSLILVRDSRLGHQGPMHAQPIAAGVYAFGGNWLWSDDARFPSLQPIPIHDVPTP
jgi:hypothetical protein